MRLRVPRQYLKASEQAREEGVRRLAGLIRRIAAALDLEAPHPIEAARKLARSPQFVLSCLAVAAGLAAGIGSIVFRTGIDGLTALLFGATSHTLYSKALTLPWWQLILVPTVGGLAFGVMAALWLRDRRPTGVVQVIEASAFQGSRLSLRQGLIGAVGNALAIGAGASVGREGPVVHLGAALGAWMGDRLRLNRPQTRTLLGCGVASAVAASFNAPIAGALFALEVVVGHYALSAFAPIVIAAVTGTIVSRLYFGDAPTFTLPGFEIASFLEFPAFALLGIFSAITAIVWMRATEAVEQAAARLPGPACLRPALAGLCVGLIAIWLPQILGIGYEPTDVTLIGGFSLQALLLLLPVKVAATAICLGCRFGTGLFSPSLFIGALLGAIFGIVATSLLPQLSSGFAAYAIVGMGAVAGSVLGAPISTILMVFELTGDYAITIGVMIATVIASVITSQVYGKSFFHRQLLRAGHDMEEGAEGGLARALRVSDAMYTDYICVLPESGLGEVREALMRARDSTLFMVDMEGRLQGMIGLADLGASAYDAGADGATRAIDVAHRPMNVVEQTDTLAKAISLLQRPHERVIPVVDCKQNMKLIGYITEIDVMRSHNACLLQARAEERGSV